MGSFFQIRSQKFPILPGEDEDLVNPGTYGKALAHYLQEHLARRGYRASFVCCEDWGWWVELKDAPFAFGVCVYCRPGAAEPVEFVCSAGAVGVKQWSWRRFRRVDTRPWVEKLQSDLLVIFRADDGVEVVGTHEAMPW